MIGLLRRGSRPRAGELNHVRKGDGPPLLLLHTLGGTLVQWNPVIDRLAREREVIAVDMPGFGGSPALPDGLEPSAANLASAALDFYDRLGLDRPAVAGISLGGWVAIDCGRQGGARAVVALCPAGFWREPFTPGRPGAHYAARVLGPAAPILLRVPGIQCAALAGNFRHPERPSAKEAVAMVRGYGGARAYVEANRLMSEGLAGDLSDLGVPLTIAWAEHDRVVRNRPLKKGILPRRV
ncbi:MAG: alpha/beta fold hydrolase, partial [Solirubrobacterales bacterium]